MTKQPTGAAWLFLALTAACTPPPASAPPPGSVGRFQAPGLGHDSVALAAGLRPLRLSPAARGEHEVRVWLFDKTGPAHLYRIVHRGNEFTGEAIRYWNGEGTSREPPPEGSIHDFVLWGLRGQCERVLRLGSLGTCRARYVAAPDWSDLLHAADAAVRDPPPGPVFSVDGPYLLVEALDIHGYRRAHLELPVATSDRPSQRRAAEVMRGIDSVEGRIVRVRRDLRLWRGMTSGQRRSAFHPCDIDEAWELRGSAPADVAPERGGLLYVELIGEVMPPGIARRRGSAFPRVLDAMGTEEVRPWTGVECDGVEQALPPDPTTAASPAPPPP